MLNTYRDSAARGQQPLQGLLLFMLISGVLIVPVVVRDGFTRNGAVFLGIVFIPVVPLLIPVYRRQYLGTCHEIRLDDQGDCELKTRRRTIRVHAQEIHAVRYHPATDEGAESYEIRFKSGKVVVAHTMTDFLDFLRRLKSFNPAVELIRFPAVAEPVLGESASTRGRTEIGYVVRSVAFPAIVVVLLIWLAIQTLR